MPFGSAHDRVDTLVRVIDDLYDRLGDPAAQPRLLQDRVPLMIGGNGDRMLTPTPARRMKPRAPEVLASARTCG
ncbi:hypothetical protein [Frankia sp. AgB32]|uniref:hypothetical protein n=1 Tax=Frankia sp. AgB32 TaxID=631119 RepID=UPI00200D7C9F|nr:hypothetical protein [Frankia sp. AgB32]MCK9898311.1 hypothetical protein [Frankia sp. AgB32]